MIGNCIKTVLKSVIPNVKCAPQNVRALSTSSSLFREVENRKLMLKSLPKLDEGTAGEKNAPVDSIMQQSALLFHTTDSMTRLFNGVPFNQIPIVNIRVSKNNSIFTFTDIKGTPKIIRSCGIEGFKNAKKGTNIAGQTTAITFGGKILEKGIKTVRIRVRGLGPGRMSSIKGLQMAGLEIISITDSTRVSWNPPRPRKQRKL